MARRRYYRDDWYYFPPSQPIEVEGGIKAKSQRGQIGKTWWAGRWIRALEAIMDSKRLARGRRYARKGQVLEINEQAGVITARVQGSRRTPYNVRIEITPLSDEEWDKVVEAMAEQALFAAKLLAGEMPPNIEEAFATAGVSLFPGRSKDLVTSCSCPDWANPCKHIAAVYFLLGERFDEDPFLLFRLRGRTKEQIMEALRAKRAAGAAVIAEPATPYEPEQTPAVESAPLEASLDRYWDLGEDLDDFRVTIAPPPVEAAVLKRLGAPPFWEGPQDFLSSLGAIYAAVTARAMEQAFGQNG
ncbi:MAG: SWIM zinc finger family protein [Anaerolineae bacterium]|nr:SWIM zinc finger family protein [Anaerolineae bacterium]